MTPGKSYNITPPAPSKLPVLRVISSFFFQCSQWEHIWNSQLIGKYKEMSVWHQVNLTKYPPQYIWQRTVWCLHCSMLSLTLKDRYICTKSLLWRQMLRKLSLSHAFGTKYVQNHYCVGKCSGNCHFQMHLAPNMYKIITLNANAKKIITLKCIWHNICTKPLLWRQMLRKSLL